VPSTIAKISWFPGILSSEYFAQIFLISDFTSFFEGRDTANKFWEISEHAFEKTVSQSSIDIVAKLGHKCVKLNKIGKKLILSSPFS